MPENQTAQEERDIKITMTKLVENKQGEEFRVYETVTKKGKRLTVKLTRDAIAGMTKELGIIEIDQPCTITSDDCNLDKSNQYPILWVRHITKVTPRENVRDNSDLDEIL